MHARTHTHTTVHTGMLVVWRAVRNGSLCVLGALDAVAGWFRAHLSTHTRTIYLLAYCARQRNKTNIGTTGTKGQEAGWALAYAREKQWWCGLTTATTAKTKNNNGREGNKVEQNQKRVPQSQQLPLRCRPVQCVAGVRLHLCCDCLPFTQHRTRLTKEEGNKKKGTRRSSPRRPAPHATRPTTPPTTTGRPDVVVRRREEVSGSVMCLYYAL
eukprot:TRINITY_DN726_c0_g3_i5.p1 TRINITY_DN726_c0_g3~~TRINITY_DN726_c0_g3_i5.p1  ORF type:complete len:213 (-),score=4.91 TRINITY_DN726_c0_g3_i5:627-1265(-)